MSEMKTLLPGATLGLLGGGQLGRMFSQAAARMGYHVAVLEPGENSPAGEVSLKQITRSYDDAEGLQTLAQCAQAVTTEFENVPAKEPCSARCPRSPDGAACRRCCGHTGPQCREVLH